MSKYKVRINVNLTKVQYEKIKKMSKERGTTYSEIIRQLIYKAEE